MTPNEKLMQLMEQYDELFGDSPILGINEPAPLMNIWGRPIQTENDLVEIYEKCLEERKPWDEYIADEPPEEVIQ